MASASTWLNLLIRDLKKVTDYCSALQVPLPDQAGDSFSHGGKAKVAEGR